jgi:putative acetyltransferase
MAPAGYEIVRARPEHLARLPGIELAAATLLRGYASPNVLQETTSAPTFARAAHEGRLWIATAHNEPIGFALVEMLAPGLPHLEEVDVLPAHGRRGVGTALVRAACEWASTSGYRTLTLTTFRDVPFNMPFYAGLGFTAIDRANLHAELSALVDRETNKGLLPGSRIAMAYDACAVIRRAVPSDREALLDIWLRSARATHTFVSASGLESLIEPVRDYLASDGELWVLCAATGRRLGFMGLSEHRLESLFLDPDVLRRGFGRRLVSHAYQLRGHLAVSVNEQNGDAVAFYRACGFRIEGRSPLDDDGRPYPLLHMRSERSVDGPIFENCEPKRSEVNNQ